MKPMNHKIFLTEYGFANQIYDQVDPKLRNQIRQTFFGQGETWYQIIVQNAALNIPE